MVTAVGVPLPSRVQPTSPLHLLLLSTVMTSPRGKRSCAELLTLSYFSFRIGTMTSSVPWKFHLPSYAPTSVPVLRVPIKRGSQLSISTEHSRVLKLLGSSVSAPGKPLLCQDHEALCDCPLSPRASGSLLLSSALSTNGFRPSHCLLLLLHPPETSSGLCDGLLRDQQPLLPARCGVSINFWPSLQLYR